jgi:putative ABC transport system permease protein
VAILVDYVYHFGFQYVTGRLLPAFVLSSFQPIQTLKSVAGFAGLKRSRNVLRKTLVVLQFTAAIILIGGAVGFYQQLKFMSSRDLGIDVKQTLVLQQTANQDSSKIQAIESFINDLQSIPGVQTVATSTDVPGSEVGSSSSFRSNTSNDEKTLPHFWY